MDESEAKVAFYKSNYARYSLLTLVSLLAVFLVILLLKPSILTTQATKNTGNNVGGGKLSGCTLTYTGNIPLNDLGTGMYKGYEGGLYPNGLDPKPTSLATAAQTVASQIQPLNASGQPDSVNGKIVMISIGMSNTTMEFNTGSADSFEPRANADPAKNSQLVIVDGAQSGKDATQWTDPSASTWSNVNSRLSSAGVTPAQVRVVWVKEALANVSNYGVFPAHAQTLKTDLEAIARNIKTNYPNAKIAYISSRTRAWTTSTNAINPEPYAYEEGFSTQWIIADQINETGNLNWDASKGTVVAPLLLWGPYLWADGNNPRSDGLTWLVTDVQTDCIHPTSNGDYKVASELLSFFKTDPSATGWFLKTPASGQAPTISASASTSSGNHPLTVNFNASATAASGSIEEYMWTFDDGDFATTQNPTKIFPAAGTYNARVTAKDHYGNSATATVTVTAN